MIKALFQNHRASGEKVRFGLFHYNYKFANEGFNGVEIIIFGYGIVVGNEWKKLEQ